jgi:hypothetical protein
MVEIADIKVLGVVPVVCLFFEKFERTGKKKSEG